MLQCGGNISKYPWPAEELVKCVEDKTSTKAAAVDRPSATKHPLFPVAAVSFLVVLAYAAWKVYNSPIVRITALWGIGACAVFWFSTSGGMYNIIRGMPMVSVGQNGKVMWWMQVSWQVEMGWPDIHWLARDLRWAGGSHCLSLDRLA